MRKFIHYMNIVFVSIGAITALFFGEEALVIYFYLAIFQLLTGLIILAVNSLSHNNALPQILIYWGLVLLYFILIVNIDINNTLRFLIIPILIAIYHCYVTHKQTKL
ncbi:hypothetical protein [Flavobacterium sp. UBA7682]|uniref:hypothetical protein n=1 Tax=Flavobacterium sp. UBA7682 TaxID=1946560 RepID=UPI0025BC199C|nr:hypothetical protein [Flavobacterium sp. UBA7682]